MTDWRAKYRDDMSEREIEALAREMCVDPTVRAPVQGYPGSIPWEMHMRAYEAYAKRWSKQVELINLFGRGCRGGFGTEELDGFIPGWRDQLSERQRLLDQIATLKTELEHAREFAVLFLAFDGRDRGTDRMTGTLDGLVKIAVETEARCAAALKPATQ